jgi:hypothetical protein
VKTSTTGIVVIVLISPAIVGARPGARKAKDRPKEISIEGTWQKPIPNQPDLN